MIGEINKKQQLKIGKTGFTLVEILVSTTLLILVVTVCLSIFISILNSQRKVNVTQDVIENARFAMERMIKEIRMSQLSGVEGINGDLMIQLKKSATETVSVEYSVDDGVLQRDENNTGDEPLTSNKVSVESLKFNIKNTSGHPYVTIIMEVKDRNATKPEMQDSIKLQSTVSLRSYGS